MLEAHSPSRRSQMRLCLGLRLWAAAKYRDGSLRLLPLIRALSFLVVRLFLQVQVRVFPLGVLEKSWLLGSCAVIGPGRNVSKDFSM